MGRRAEGWRLEWRRGIGYVRFTHAKRQHLISTGKRDPREAGEEAARLYSRVVGGGLARPSSSRTLILAPLKVLLAEWLASLAGTLDPETTPRPRQETGQNRLRPPLVRSEPIVKRVWAMSAREALAACRTRRT